MIVTRGLGEGYGSVPAFGMGEGFAAPTPPVDDVFSGVLIWRMRSEQLPIVKAAAWERKIKREDDEWLLLR